jgi:4'-phosphopantetheinyl transferase EntD
LIARTIFGNPHGLNAVEFSRHSLVRDQESSVHLYSRSGDIVILVEPNSKPNPSSLHRASSGLELRFLIGKQALPSPCRFYPTTVCWTTKPSPNFGTETEGKDRFSVPNRMSIPKDSANRRQEMFRAGRMAAYSSLVKAGFQDPLMEDLLLGANHQDIPISDAHLLSIVARNPDRSPCWPVGFVGSISHSDRWILAAAARASDSLSIGIDTEPIVTDKIANDLKSDIGIDSEWKLLGDTGLNTAFAFTLLFSAKESFYKCWYPLRKQYLNFLDVEAIELKHDNEATSENANYGTSTLLRSNCDSDCGLGWDNTMSLNVRYCITEKDVFTIATIQ